MEAYSDGVFSIASTLLVLDIALRPPGSPLEQLRHGWPGYLGYVVSFLTISAAWIGHSALTDRLTHADSLLVRINVLLLLVVAFLPFPTKLIAESLRNTNAERTYVTLYGLTLLTVHLLIFALGAYARREHLYSHDQEGDELRRERRSLWPVIFGYAVAIVTGIFAPTVAVLAYLALALYLVIPFRDIRRLRSRRS
jgi:uncharacterized membrane protein